MSLQSSHETLFLSIINTNRDALHVYSHQQLLLDLPSPHYIPASSLPLPSPLLSSSSPPSNPSAHFSPSYQTAEIRCLIISSDGFQFRYQFKNLTSNIQGLRLRWLNYLKPDIRRGEFEEDEVDLIIKLHKLLGNRWSLIAGRLPGRTANDVKNYWNFHLSKRLSMQKGEQSQIKSMKPTTTTTAKIIRPKPRTFSPNSLWLNGVGSSIVEAQLQKMSYNTMLASPGEESTLWWKSLLADGEEEDDTWWSKSGEVGLEVELPQIFGVGEMEMMNKKEEEGLGEWKNMLLDLDQWGLWET